MVRILHLDGSSGIHSVSLVSAFSTLDNRNSPHDMHESPYGHEHFVHVHGVLRAIVHSLSWFAGVPLIILRWVYTIGCKDRSGMIRTRRLKNSVSLWPLNLDKGYSGVNPPCLAS